MLNRIGRYIVSLIALLLLSSCGRASTDAPGPEAAGEAARMFVGKAWLSVDPSAAPGTLRSFLPDGTLIMDSCFETYRLARWRTVLDGVVEWNEDGAEIQAEVEQATPEELELRLKLKTEVKVERYRLAQAPVVCPDVPR